MTKIFRHFQKSLQVYGHRVNNEMKTIITLTQISITLLIQETLSELRLIDSSISNDVQQQKSNRV